MNIIKLEEVASTNLYAKKNLDSFEDKTIISAIRQISGRGRFNREWIDLGEDNIFMSIILKPSDKFDIVYTNLTQYLSVTLCKVLENYGLKPTIKWPNDVLIDGSKIAGILSETVMQGTNFKGLVLGIGVNLNSNKVDLKQIKDKKATALNIELSKEHVNKETFMKNLLDMFFSNYEKFLKEGFPLISEEYISKTEFLGKEISVQVLNEKKTGIAKKINDEGELIIENHGNEIVLTMGDIL